MTDALASPHWFLEIAGRSADSRWQVPLATFPFRIGRLQGLELTLDSRSISKIHAEITQDGEALRLRDLESTNGTFLNGRRLVGEAAIASGDVVHLADIEVRLGRGPISGGTTQLVDMAVSTKVAEATRAIPELLASGAVQPVYQPIVSLDGGAIFGFEALGRGLHPDLPTSPVELFEVARTMGQAAQLSRLLRARGAEGAGVLPHSLRLFLNSSLEELGDPELLRSIQTIRALYPEARLVLEIHERSVTRGEAIGDLRRALAELTVEIAYDDFGAGESRLVELAEIPPDHLKFDRSWLHGRGKKRASGGASGRLQLLASLIRIATDLGCTTIAEGVETAAEHEICRQVGFSHAQGFWFGRPLPFHELPRAGEVAAG